MSRADSSTEDPSYTYNGSKQIPEVEVKLNNQTLDLSVYEVTAENNQNAGTASYTVKGITSPDIAGNVRESFV